MSAIVRQSALLAAALMCVGAMLPGLPYSYFMLLRVVMCGVMLLTAWSAFERQSSGIGWACVGVAILFNPVLKVHLTREGWWWVDGAAAVWCFFLARNLGGKIK